MRRVASLRRRDAAVRLHAQDRLGLVEHTAAFARFHLEQQPRDRAPSRSRRIRLCGGHYLAAGERLPGRARIVLADLLLLRVEQLRLGRLEHPGRRARVVLAAGVDLYAGRRHFEIGREPGRLERDRKLVELRLRDGRRNRQAARDRGENQSSHRAPPDV
jgi:hypothetical protein